MELQEKYKEVKHTIYKRGRKVVIEDKKELFPLYKKLGLDVFKIKKNDSTKKGSSK